jgi:hypothetical protein
MNEPSVAAVPARQSRLDRPLATAAWVVTLALGGASLWAGLATDVIDAISASNGATPSAGDLLLIRAVLVAFVAISIGYATVGALLAGRAGAGRIGALMQLGGLTFALILFGYLVGGRLALDGRGGIAGAVLMLGPAAVGPGYSLVLPAIAIAFPDGHLPSARWRPWVSIAAGIIAVSAVLQLLRPGRVVATALADIRNPFGVDVIPAGLIGAADVGISVGILAISAIGVVAVVVRYRRGDGIERQQQRWFLAAVALGAVPLALSSLPVVGGPTMALVAAVGLALVPIAVGIAVTRYRLYEIDHLINRTLVYVPLTALLAGLYAATVTLLQRLFQSFTGDRSDAAIIISTLILASVFTPIRKWLESVVDRRFKPSAATSTNVQGPGNAAWEARVAEIAREAVRRELDARAAADVPTPVKA